MVKKKSTNGSKRKSDVGMTNTARAPARMRLPHWLSAPRGVPRAAAPKGPPDLAVAVEAALQSVILAAAAAGELGGTYQPIDARTLQVEHGVVRDSITLWGAADNMNVRIDLAHVLLEQIRSAAQPDHSVLSALYRDDRTLQAPAHKIARLARWCAVELFQYARWLHLPSDDEDASAAELRRFEATVRATAQALRGPGWAADDGKYELLLLCRSVADKAKRDDTTTDDFADAALMKWCGFYKHWSSRKQLQPAVRAYVAAHRLYDRNKLGRPPDGSPQAAAKKAVRAAAATLAELLELTDKAGNVEHRASALERERHGNPRDK